MPRAADGNGAVGRPDGHLFVSGYAQSRSLSSRESGYAQSCPLSLRERVRVRVVSVGVRAFLQVGAQEPARVRGVAAAHLLRRARRHQMPAGVAALRSQVDEVVGALDDLHVVLDDQQRVPLRQQPLESPQERGDIVEVQAGGGLVEDQQPLAAPRSGSRTGLVLAHVEGQLEPLRLAAGQRVERLPEAHVVQPHVPQRLQRADEGGRVVEER